MATTDPAAAAASAAAAALAPAAGIDSVTAVSTLCSIRWNRKDEQQHKWRLTWTDVAPSSSDTVVAVASDFDDDSCLYFKTATTFVICFVRGIMGGSGSKKLSKEDMDFLIDNTNFSKQQIKAWYKGFMVSHQRRVYIASTVSAAVSTHGKHHISTLDVAADNCSNKAEERC